MADDLCTNSLLLQVVSHLLVVVFRQLLVTVVVVLGKDGLDLGIRVALPVPRQHRQQIHIRHKNRKKFRQTYLLILYSSQNKLSIFCSILGTN